MPVYEFTSIEYGGSWTLYDESWENTLNPTSPGQMVTAPGYASIGALKFSLGSKNQMYQSSAFYLRFDTTSIVGKNIIKSELSFKTDERVGGNIVSTLSAIAQGNLGWYSDEFLYSRDHLNIATRWSPVEIPDEDETELNHVEDVMSLVAANDYVVVFTGDNLRTGVAPPDSPADSEAYYYGGRVDQVLANSVLNLTTYDPIAGSDVLFGAFSL
jgi:hypothetical protein